MIAALSVVSCLGVLAVCFALFAKTLRRPASVSRPGRGRAILVALVVAVVAFLRPHHDTFIGLDTSAYRMMDAAFEAGRGFHDTDEVLMSVPEDIRHWFLLLPERNERDTRDHSFQITRFEEGATAPFFYPLLPLCMNGFDILVPGEASDLFVPLLGVLFAIALCMFGYDRKGWLGFLLAMVFLFATSHPVWTFRGAYVEAVGAILIGLTMLLWLREERGADMPASSYLALGLAMSFHPVMLVMALVLAALYLLSGSGRGKVTCVAAACFVAGLAPYVLMTLFVAQPYGAIDPATLKHNYVASAAHRTAMQYAAVLGSLSFLAIGTARFWVPRIVGLGKQWWIWALVLGAALGLNWWMAFGATFQEADYVYRGLIHWLWGFGPVYGAAVAALLLAVMWFREGKVGLLIALVLLGLPIFFYLRGAEGMGAWSQRRLILPYLALIVSLLPVALRLLPDSAGKPSPKVVLCCVLLVFVGISNQFRRNASGSAGGYAPYLVQYEEGAGEWVESVDGVLSNRLAVVERYHYSIPLAVTLENRVLGLSEYGYRGLPEVMNWLADKSQLEPTLWIGESQVPALEHGLQFIPESAHPVRYNRMDAKSVFPAEIKPVATVMTVYQMVPASNRADLAQRKTLDGGWLGLRGKWGQQRALTFSDGVRVPAMWSRQGSGVVGPMPGVSRQVEISVVGSAGRGDGHQQRLQVQVPWSEGVQGELFFSSEVTTSSCVVAISDDLEAGDAVTAVYRFVSPTPYNPLKEDGLRRYAPDLGALISEIHIRRVPPAVDSSPGDARNGLQP